MADAFNARVVAAGKKKSNVTCFVCGGKGANNVVTRAEPAADALAAFVCPTCGGLLCVVWRGAGGGAGGESAVACSGRAACGEARGTEAAGIALAGMVSRTAHPPNPPRRAAATSRAAA